MIHDQPGHGRLMMHLVAIIADGAPAHITHAMSGKSSRGQFAGLPLVEPAGNQPIRREG